MAQGAAEGIWEGIGSGLGDIADTIRQNRQKAATIRDTQADTYGEQIRSIADNIARVGGKDAPEAAPLVAQLHDTVQKHNALYPPHETPALIARIQKLAQHKPSAAKPDVRAGMTAETAMAASPKIPDITTTDAYKLHQNDLQGQMAQHNVDVQTQIDQKKNDATIAWARQNHVPEEQINQLLAIHAGIPATLLKPPTEHSGQFTTVSGKLKDGTPFTYQRSGFSGNPVDMSGNPIAPGVLDGFVVDPKSPIKNKQAWVMRDGKPLSVMLDANNHPIPGTENPDALPPAAMSGHLTTGQFHYVDEDGNVHEVSETHTSTPIRPQIGPSPQMQAVAPPPAAAPAIPGATSTAPAGTPAPAAAAKPTPAAGIPKTPAQARDIILGNRGTPALTAAKKTYDTAVGLATFANDAMTNPSASKDKLLAGRLIREAEGRFNPAQYDNLTKGAGLGNTFDQWLNNASSGELTPMIRKQLVDVATSNLSAAKAGYDAAGSHGAGSVSDEEILKKLDKLK